ncbi:hypothetical protein ACFSL6_20355 [Paenibacillus thailandensis]|uniref:Uncharacterized protein n=1 Tax=Paenibacillus thailandensis TaxID=393250 RepID=A0ABW5R1A1_9BACL
MQTQTNKTIAVHVIEDISQRNIIRKRRQLREQMLKQVSQRTSIIERKIERLAELTR